MIRAVTAVIIVLILSANIPSVAELDYLIEELEYGRQIHEEWIEHIGAHPELAEAMGDIEWHMRWVDTYDRAIAALSSMRSLSRWMP